MLYSMQEFEIAAKSTNGDIKNNLALAPFIIILKDFFSRMLLNARGQKVLDIGPGQCDMLDFFKKAGLETWGVDMDHASVELGTLRGHNMTHVESFQKEWPYGPSQFDGLFCRGSLTYFYCINSPEEVTILLDSIFASAKPDAWVWILPWLKPSESMSNEVVHECRMAARDALKKYDITAFKPDDTILNRWGPYYTVPYREIWIRGLPYDSSWPLVQL